MSRISDFVGKSAVDNVKEALRRVRDAQDYHALLSLTEERALERAKEIDNQIEKGENPGVLAGVPFVVKDNFLAFGAPTTAASKMLENFNVPVSKAHKGSNKPLQATAVEKLEAEGAICIGKANLDAFAHGGSTENSAFGPTKNAADKTRVAGGSSGGSAVVTALDVVPFALGTDTGGSIRQPASFNGVVGVKPTYGAVSRYGVVTMASSTDTIGCFATNADDANLVMEIMAGRDNKDMTTLPDFWQSQPELAKKKIGLVKQCMTDDVDAAVRQKTLDYAEKLKQLGYEIEEVDLDMMRHSLAMYYIIVPAEISSNLARYDGVRYGHRAAEVKTLAELYGRSRNEGFYDGE